MLVQAEHRSLISFLKVEVKKMWEVILFAPKPSILPYGHTTLEVTDQQQKPAKRKKSAKL